MGIISIKFFVFAAAAILIYYLFPVKKYQWTVLLAASYTYYILNCNKYVLYMLVTTVTTYFGARILEYAAEKSKLFCFGIKRALQKKARRNSKQKHREKSA